MLANAAAGSVTDVDHQRHEPGSDADEPVRYYRQRATGGSIEGPMDLAGFQLRIEPDLTASPDPAFVPFVLAYAGDALVGIGIIEDENGDPASAQITPGVLGSYPVTMSTVAVTTGDAAIERGSARLVDCAGAVDPATRWPSGLAWFPRLDPGRPNGRARQLRLLFPDHARDATASDATERTADLDCDAHPADASDCDDLQRAFYRGAAESCDGLDTNCDSERYLAAPCAANATCSIGPNPTGVQLCDDEQGTLGACTPSAECLCASGASNCTSCTVDFATGSVAAKEACSPSVGKVKLPMCEGAGCIVEVASATNGWRAFVSTVDTGGFATTVTNVHGAVFLEVKRSTPLPASVTGIGEVYLLVTTAQATTTVPILMRMNTELGACRPIPNGNASQMTCLP